MNRNILDFSRHGSIVFYRLSYHGNSKLEYACFLRIRIVTVFYLKFNFFSGRRNTVFSRGEFNLFFGFSIFFKFWWLELLWKYTKQINGKIIRMQQKKRHGKQKLAARHRINTDVVMIEKIILIKCGWQWTKDQLSAAWKCLIYSHSLSGLSTVCKRNVPHSHKQTKYLRRFARFGTICAD